MDGLSLLIILLITGYALNLLLQLICNVGAFCGMLFCINGNYYLPLLLSYFKTKMAVNINDEEVN